MPAQHVLATSDGDRRIEGRSGMQTTWAGGWGGNMVDFAAIPPPGMGHTMRAGVMVSQQSLLQLDVVFTALRIITTAILKMGDPRAFREEMNPESIPFKRFLRKQPPVLSDTFGGRLFQYDGRRRTIMSMGLLGEAFWYVIARDRLEYPAALEVLHPMLMEIKLRDDGGLEYLYGTGKDKKRLDPENVIHIPFMTMPQDRRALSPVEYASVSGALALAAYEFGSSWFRQGASPSFILSTDQKIGQEEVERIAEKFVIEHSGLPQAHLPLVLDSGLKADKVMSSPDEAQYLETLEYARNVIASWFGVDELLPNALQRQPAPPAKTAQERMQRFITLTLSGYTVPLEEAYSSLLPRDRKATFDATSLLEPDATSLGQLIEALRQSQTATVNDIRGRVLQWPPSDDPNADEIIQPLASNTAPAQTEPPKAKPAGSPEPKPKET